MAVSCLNCSKFLIACRNPKKGPRYSCEDFKALKDHKDILDLFSIPLEPEAAGAQKTAGRKQRKIIQVRQQRDLVDVNGDRIYNDDDPSGDSDGLDTDSYEDPLGYDSLSPDDLEERYRKQNDFYRVMRDGYDSLTNTVKDMRIDDGDFTLAKNNYDFACNYMGPHAKRPFARQLWIIAVLCGEYCPRCMHHSVRNIEDVPVDADPDEIADKLCMLDHGVCPRCGTGKSTMVLSGELNDYAELVACLGQRSGKTAALSNIPTAYWMHRILMMPKYSQLCPGVQDFSPITITLVALSFGRAFKLLWSPLVMVLKTSNFFTDYHAMLKQQGKKFGTELFSFRKGSLFYAHKNLEIAPMGPSMRTLRGDSRVLGSVDELGWFKVPPVVNEDEDGNPEEIEREIANADEVYQALDRSMITLRSGVYNLYKKGYNHIPSALGLWTSSPASYRDKICTLLREAEGSTRSLGVNLPTWEVNPFIPRDTPDIVEAYRKNPVKAERDWGAKPPNINAALYSQETLEPIFSGENHFGIQRVVTSKSLSYGKVVQLKQRWVWPGSVLALDAGAVNNSFAFALLNGRYQDQIIGADVTAVGEVMPSKEQPISFPLMYEHCIKPLIKYGNVKFLVADRWNSIMLLQTAERDFPGLQTFIVSLKGSDFDKADADYIDTGLVTLPKMELDIEDAEKTPDYRKTFGVPPKPASHLYLQFRTVRKMGGTRLKGDQYTDDIYRAVMLGLTCLRHPKMEDTLRKSRAMNTALGSASSTVALLDGRSYGNQLNNFMR